MACSFALSGIDSVCETGIVGGINTIVLFDGNDTTGYRILNEINDPITPSEMPRFIKGNFRPNVGKYAIYKPVPNTASVSSSMNIDAQTGTAYTNSTIKLTFSNLWNDKIYEFVKFMNSNHLDNIKGFFKTNVGKWYMIGAFNGLVVTGGNLNYGVNLNDGQTMTITITDIGPYPPLFCNDTLGGQIENIL